MEALNVLALNAGSSSLKFGLYRAGSQGTEMLLSGEGDSIGSEADSRKALADIARRLSGAGLSVPDAVGHRIVHGGPKLRAHCLIDDAVLRELEGAAALAPLHTPVALSIVRAAREHFPALPQAACLDTAFHAGLPDVARILPIPRQLQAEGIQRYGFHGLSCESIVRQLAAELPERMVIAHLGNGASITAVKGGKSIDTSMGLTPAGGVVMGTRSGDLDPGVLVYLAREKKYDAAGLEDLVDRRSGLLGVSGLTSDMRRLHEAAASSADARLAIRMFCYSVRKQVAAMVAALEGADLLVFTGGIGENDAETRAAICGGLAWLGAGLQVRVLASQEDEQIARHVRALVLRN
jgi:acetate kinase